MNKQRKTDRNETSEWRIASVMYAVLAEGCSVLRFGYLMQPSYQLYIFSQKNALDNKRVVTFACDYTTVRLHPLNVKYHPTSWMNAMPGV